MSGFYSVPVRQEVKRHGIWWLPRLGDDQSSSYPQVGSIVSSVQDWVESQREAAEAERRAEQLKNWLIVGGAFVIGYFVGSRK